MKIIQAVIMGIIQGLTEFLPVSSSAHLVIFPYLFGWEFPADQVFPFDVLVQVGTLLAVIVYFWHDLWMIARDFVFALWKRDPFGSEHARMGWYLILASIPGVVLGVLLGDVVEQVFHSPLFTAIALLITAALMYFAEVSGQLKRSLEQFKWKDSLWIGLAQALAIFPGISRSGATISAGMFRQLDRKSSARFSFLMAVPIMLGAGLMSFLDLLDMPGLGEFLPVLGVGFVTSAVVGYLSIRWLLHFLTHHSLKIFSAYCLVLSVLTLVIWLVR